MGEERHERSSSKKTEEELRKVTGKWGNCRNQRREEFQEGGDYDPVDVLQLKGCKEAI